MDGCTVPASSEADLWTKAKRTASGTLWGNTFILRSIQVEDTSSVTVSSESMIGDA